MGPRDAVSRFLKDFKSKMKIWDVLFRDDRGKNTQTLLDLEITPNARKAVLEKLEVDDYSEGPLSDTLNMRTDMWVFGKMIEEREVYIKITMGHPGAAVICISFHIAEYKMTYPLKKQT